MILFRWAERCGGRYRRAVAALYADLTFCHAACFNSLFTIPDGRVMPLISCLSAGCAYMHHPDIAT